MKRITISLLALVLSLNGFAQIAGTIDNSFQPNNAGIKGAQGPVYEFLELLDGHIMVAGQFSSYNQIDRGSLVKIAPDGSMDASFNLINFVVGGTSGSSPLLKALALQSDGKIIVGGNFEVNTGVPNFEIVAQDLIRLHPDGSQDTSFIAPENITNCGDVEDIIVQPDGKIIVVGNITFCVGSTIDNNENIIRLNADGSLDTNFQVSANGFSVSKVLLQPDGKIIIGGIFNDVNGEPREGIARINSDGTLDNSFNIGTGFNDDVEDMALQSDGKIIVVGDFTEYNGSAHNKIVRLNSDGSVDGSFSSGDGPGQYFESADTTFPRDLDAVHLQADGKLIIGGKFNRYNGFAVSKVARLNTDGTLDTTFNAVDDKGTSTGNVVTVLALSNNKIAVGGSFNNLMQRRMSRISVLNTDGTIDQNFNKTFGPVEGGNGTTLVKKIRANNSGGYFVTGQFREYDDIPSRNIAKLEADGTYDSNFSAGTDIFNGFDDDVLDFVVQSDGKVVVVGEFENYNQTAAPGIIRINADGTVDTSFSVGTGIDTANGRRIETIILQPDGKLLISGFFFEYNGISLEQFGRLNSDGSIDTSLDTGAGLNNVDDIFLLDNNQIMLSGVSSYNGIAIPGELARINADGTLDSAFDASEILGGQAHSLAETSNGQYYIGGIFGTLGNPQPSILKLNANGSIDTTFNPVSIMQTSNSNGVIYDIEVQADGKIIIGGNFNSVNGRTLRGLARLQSDGSLDETFNPENTSDEELSSGLSEFSEVLDLLLEDSGRLLVAGQFGAYNTENKTPLIAVHADAPQTLSNDLLEKEPQDFRLFPNPADDHITIVSEQPINSYQIFDLSGKLISKSININAHQHLIRLNALSQGIYLIKIDNENGSLTKKLIIN